MRDRHRLLLTAPLAALTLAVMVSVAGATTYNVAGRRFKATFNPLSFGSTATERPVRCAVTLEGSFVSSTFNETRGARIASVTSARASGCTGGTATVLSETLPWAVNYASSSGTAPNITGLTHNLVGAAFRVQPTALVACLARSTAERPVAHIWARETNALITSLRFEPSSRIPLTGALCEFTEGYLEGSTTSFTSPDEEEARVIVLVDGVNGALVERNDRTRLVNVMLGRGEDRLLEMLNNAAIRSARLVGDPTSTDNVNFRVETSAGRCVNGATLSPGLGGAACTIRIVTRAETPAGASARIRIRYRLGFGVLGDSLQEFEVRT